MTGGLKILIVHNCEDLTSARRSTLDYIRCFERHAPDNGYLYHRIMLPVTPTMIATHWDAIIFDSTALGIVSIRPRYRFHRIIERWRFARESAAVKIVFPQDDASHGALLDYWFNWMQVDAVFTVRPEKKEFIYPFTTKRADFISTVSGFIEDDTISAMTALAKPFADRQWTVGQRATMYPAWGGRFAQRKGLAAVHMKEACAARRVLANISTEDRDVLLGDDWYRFLGDCRFVVGAEGGHGMWDAYGVIQDAVNDYAGRHPNAPFEEIEENCFDGLDGMQLFPGFAPRVLEAALLGCGQVLMEGEYRGFVRPHVHYIPLKIDFSNMDDVFSAMANIDEVQAMIAATRRDLVESTAFRYSNLVATVMEYISARLAKKAAPVKVTTGLPDPSLRDLERLHLRELYAAMVVQGIDEEKLYEPYLSQWVRRELRPQVIDPALHNMLGFEEERTHEVFVAPPIIDMASETKQIVLGRAKELLQSVYPHKSLALSAILEFFEVSNSQPPKPLGVENILAAIGVELELEASLVKVAGLGRDTTERRNAASFRSAVEILARSEAVPDDISALLTAAKFEPGLASLLAAIAKLLPGTLEPKQATDVRSAVQVVVESRSAPADIHKLMTAAGVDRSLVRLLTDLYHALPTPVEPQLAADLLAVVQILVRSRSGRADIKRLLTAARIDPNLIDLLADARSD